MNEKKPTWGSKTKPLSGQKRVDVSAFEIETGVLRRLIKTVFFLIQLSLVKFSVMKL